MSQPRVTIVISPRERFSFTQQNLESIYDHTQTPFELIYVDGGSPAPIQHYLQTQAHSKGFKLIRSEQYLAPNQARNLAIPQIKTEYLLFVDNDVLVSPAWLDRLVQCADETGASVVCPLTCIGKTVNDTIHLAGGEAHIYEEPLEDGSVARKVHEKHYFVNRPVAEVKDQLHRQQCEFAEFHCMLVRTEIFARIGLLDEGFLSTREHIDFCMSVANVGGTLYCEPDSVVTYVPELPLNWADVSFFLLRWSDAWEMSSLEHFQTKWNLTQKDKYFKKRYKRLGHRRHHAFLRPLVRQMPFGKDNAWLEQQAIKLERVVNRWITKRYANKYSNQTSIPHDVIDSIYATDTEYELVKARR
ncbi:glycosyltransferase [Myxacorys almedinensis A]|uniref:Glycosyltransferase n=2 Tax=Myxacorys TaxID=2056239 RepID=A0A8J8CIF3_9CYAN|nr:glycosyltransferase [Myxacorys almedinensis]NDJ16446.1 glycosyltransferase [Myxacorys almedinensis A]